MDRRRRIRDPLHPSRAAYRAPCAGCKLDELFARFVDPGLPGIAVHHRLSRGAHRQTVYVGPLLDDLNDPLAKAMMLLIAKDYEVLAERAEERAENLATRKRLTTRRSQKEWRRG